MKAVLAADEALAAAVSLRRAVRDVEEREQKERLAGVEQRLRRALGPAVPKGVAARALRISDTALDRWMARGLVPLVRTPGKSRLRVETAPLLELLEQVEELREAGEQRPVSAALRRLGRRPPGEGPWIISIELARLPRPNPPAWELAAAAQASTPLERLESVASLSEALTTLSALRTAA